MKKYLYLTVIILLTYSCNKDDDFVNGKPKIIFEKRLPNEMQNYTNFSNPILYDNYLIITSSDYQNNKSTFFKLDKNGNFIDKWNVDNDHLLGNYLHHNEIYLYRNQLIYNSKYFGVSDEKIISINLDNMETNWEISSASYRSGLKGLDNKIYLNKYISNGYEIYEVNLDNQNIELVYQVTNGSYGLFVLPHEPCVYKIDNNNVGVLITSSNNSSYTLINYNISTQQVIWKVDIPEFNNVDVSGPTEVQLINEKIVITSNNYISIRNFDNGDYKWSKFRMSSYVVDKPIIGEGVITDSTDKLFCYNINNGTIIWSREQQDGIWVGKNEGKVIYNNFLFDKVPINIQTGEAIWVKLDNWGELDLEFEGKPAIEIDELYYIGYRTRKLYKVEMPY
jgi:outer membrane protein assembly factor BamB